MCVLATLIKSSAFPSSNTVKELKDCNEFQGLVCPPQEVIAKVLPAIADIPIIDVNSFLVSFIIS
jgi:hypothetical protein